MAAAATVSARSSRFEDLRLARPQRARAWQHGKGLPRSGAHATHVLHSQATGSCQGEPSKACRAKAADDAHKRRNRSLALPDLRLAPPSPLPRPGSLALPFPRVLAPVGLLDAW